MNNQPKSIAPNVYNLDISKHTADDVKATAIDAPPPLNLSEEKFPPRKNERYEQDDMLTIGGQTKKIRTWINDDPVALHKIKEEYDIILNDSTFRTLLSKIRIYHIEYYRKFMRLRVTMEGIKGFPTEVKAFVPYNEAPVQFYKWWLKNQEKVVMSFAEKIKLFLTVDRLDSKALIKAHKELIQKKSDNYIKFVNISHLDDNFHSINN